MRMTSSVSLALLLNVLGCGSDSNNSSDTAGVPRSTALKDVTNSQLADLCKANQSQLESINNCMTDGLDESTEAECMATVSACEKTRTASSSDIDCAAADNSGLKDCPITVGEFSDCLAELERYIGSLSCKDAGKTLSPPSCFSTLTSKCESIFD